MANNPKNLKTLNLFRGIVPLQNTIEPAYARSLNEVIFREVWEYAVENDREALKESCLEFLRGHENKEGLTSKWGIRDLPKELAEAFKSSLEKID